MIVLCLILTLALNSLENTFRGITDIFFWGGKVIFPDFFPGVKCFFPSRKFPFWYTQNKFPSFSKVKSIKKKSPHFFLLHFLLPFPIFHLRFYNFPSFLLNFHPFSLSPFFLIRRQKFPGQKSLGGTLPPLSAPRPPACYATDYLITKNVADQAYLLFVFFWENM